MSNKGEIKFKSKISYLIYGVLLVLIAIPVEVAMIQGFREDGRDGIIAIVILSIFFTGMLVLGGIGSIHAYFADGKHLKKALKKYGKETLVSSIHNTTIHTFRSPLTNHKVYFTERFIIDSGEAIFEYQEIKKIYKYIQRSHRARIPMIAFELKNGNTHYLCKCVEDKEIMEIARLCQEKNPQIVVNIVSAAQETSKVMIWLGRIFIIFAIVFAIAFTFGMGYVIDKAVNAVSESKRQELLDAGYYEYKTEGYYFDRDINYNFGKSKRPTLDDLYIFELADKDGMCLGVITQSPNWYTFNGEVCQGYQIFNKKEGKKEKVKSSSGKEYEAIVIDVDDIVATYGIPSEETIQEKVYLKIGAVILSVPMLIIGLILLIIGHKKAKKQNIKQK